MSDFNFVTTRVATGGALTDTSAATLQAAGITHCIDCRAEGGDDQAKLTAAFSVLWDPTADDGTPKPAEWWDKGVQFALDALTHHHTKVLVHCAAGVNRGPSMAFAIMLALGWDVVYAERQIREQRPQVGLAYRDDAIVKLAGLGWTS